MLIGEYIHTLDEKNRISVPFKFRKELGRRVIITPGLDQCLFVFSSGEWQRVSEKLSGSRSDLSFLRADQRTFNRNLFGQASEVEVDAIGRILIPDFLKEKINLKNSAALVGLRDRVEIWNERAWSAFKQKAGREAEKLAEKLAGAKRLGEE
jgi:MraZ protein